MTIEEIRANAPECATHYRIFGGLISYYKVSGSIYRYDSNQWIYFDIAKFIKFYDLKPLH